jgi:hypothetical protein
MFRLILVLSFFISPNLQAKWKFNEILGDYFETDSHWVYSLDYQNWFHVKTFEEKGFWAYKHSTTLHFRGFMYFSKENKNYSFFVPSYIITDSSSLIELGTWIYRIQDKSFFWSKQSNSWSSEPFVLVWNQYYYSTNGGWVNNTNGRFAWDDTYALDGLAFLNRIKPSIEISKLGDSVVERFLDGLNSRQNFSVDGVTNQFIEGWASESYTEGMYHTWNVHTAYILNAIGEFYLSKASISTQEIRQLKEIFAYIEGNWIDLEVGGYFNEPSLKQKNIEIPLNMVSLGGCASLTLYNLTKEEKYLNYAKQIFLHLQNNIEIINSCAIWPYKPLQNKTSESLKLSDDISHGALVIKFIKMCKNQGIELSLKNITIANLDHTFTSIFREDGKLSKYAYAEEGKTKNLTYYIFPPHWLMLVSTENFKLYKTFNEKLSLTYDPSTIYNHFGRDLVLNHVLINYISVDH